MKYELSPHVDARFSSSESQSEQTAGAQWQKMTLISRGAQVPINPYLMDQSFDPEHVRAMGVAFENACRSLRLTNDADRMSEVIASKIIATAKGGERDAVRLYDVVMQWACAA